MPNSQINENWWDVRIARTMPSEIMEEISFPTALDKGLGPIGFAAASQMLS